MSQTSPDTPFPLPLEPFEAFLLADDRPQHPMSFFLRLDFAGELNRSFFESALTYARKRNPLQAARIETSGGRPCFVAAPQHQQFLDWAVEGTALAPPGGGIGIDPRLEGGPRTWVRVGKDRSQATFQFHHAFCDGLGGMQFLEDVLAGYALECGSTGTVRPLDVALLRRRGHFEIPPRSLYRQVADTFIGLGFAYRFLGISATRLAAPARNEAPGIPFPGFVVQRLEEDETRALHRAASRRDVTTNDLVMAAFFQVLEAWNARHPGDDRQPVFRVLMPTSLRDGDSAAMPAANRMSFTFLERPWHACRDFERLVAGIRDETRAIKRYRLGLYFLGGLGLASAMPGFWQVWLRRRRCFASAVITNLGDPSRRFAFRFPRRDGRCVVGDVVLEAIHGVPPIRAETRAGLAVISYAGRLGFSLICDPAHFTTADAADLLASLRQRLREA